MNHIITTTTDPNTVERCLYSRFIKKKRPWLDHMIVNISYEVDVSYQIHLEDFHLQCRMLKVVIKRREKALSPERERLKHDQMILEYSPTQL